MKHGDADWPLQFHGSIDRAFFDKVDHVPPGSAIFAADPRNRADAIVNYHALRGRDTFREVALVRNLETGEYKVIQGFDAEVPVPGRRWMLEAHSHPRVISLDMADRLAVVMPSGSGADMALLKRDVDQMSAGARPGDVVVREATIDGFIGLEPFQTTYGVWKQGDAYHFYVEFTDPRTGSRQSITAPTVAAYDIAASTLTGFKFGHLADNFGSAPPRIRTDSGDADALLPVRHGDRLSGDEHHRIGAYAQSEEQVERFSQQMAGDEGTAGYHAALRADADQQLLELGLVGRPIRSSGCTGS